MPPVIQELPRRLLERPATTLALGAILAVCAFQLWITPDNPPGFFRDEASMALDVSTLSTSLHDSNGALLPLYISTFEDYFSPVFVYTLAAVFRVTGPHAEVARGLSAVGILAAVLLLGLLAYRRTGDRTVGVVALVLAGTTPWLFEVGRLAFEVGFEPLVIVLLLLPSPGQALGSGSATLCLSGSRLGRSSTSTPPAACSDRSTPQPCSSSLAGRGCDGSYGLGDVCADALPHRRLRGPASRGAQRAIPRDDVHRRSGQPLSQILRIFSHTSSAT